ncbi:MAG: hypothetical protein KGJ43_07090 [Acidobacteriota bacterium]|nr:hypothetical protein [Acidobacteriota bacterium]
MRTAIPRSLPFHNPAGERRREARRSPGRRRGDQAHAGADQDAVRDTESPDGTAPAPAPPDGAARHARTTGEPPLDVALYTCQCGLVFSAAVSTTVHCPHCGAVQAW